MKPRTLIGFAIVTAVVTAAALVTVANRYWISAATATVKPFPGLIDRINDVDEIDIKTKGETTTIKHTPSGWVMVNKHDYPVQAEKAKGAAIGFGEMEFAERKTARSDRYNRLWVEDVDGKDAKSRLVTLKDAKGQTMAELIVGRPREGRMGGQGGLYVRRPGEVQAWFAPANFEIPLNTSVWLEPRIIHVNAKRIARITTIQPGGEKMVIYKDSPGAAHFLFKDLPADKKLKGEAVADDMDSILTAVDLADVAPQSEVSFTDKVWHAEVETFDGLDVKIDLVDRAEKIWGRFTAAAEKPLVDVASQPEAAKKFLRSADDVAKEAAEINARVANWAYEFRGYQGEKLQANLAIFLENETPPADMGSTGGFGPGGPADEGVPPGMGGPPPGQAGEAGTPDKSGTPAKNVAPPADHESPGPSSKATVPESK